MYFPNIQILLLCDKKCCFLCVIPKSEQKRSFCAYLQIECDFLKLTNVLNWLLGFLGIRPLISSYFYKLDHIGYLKGMFPQISEKNHILPTCRSCSRKIGSWSIIFLLHPHSQLWMIEYSRTNIKFRSLRLIDVINLSDRIFSALQTSCKNILTDLRRKECFEQPF